MYKIFTALIIKFLFEHGKKKPFTRTLVTTNILHDFLMLVVRVLALAAAQTVTELNRDHCHIWTNWQSPQI